MQKDEAQDTILKNTFHLPSDEPVTHSDKDDDDDSDSDCDSDFFSDDD